MFPDNSSGNLQNKAHLEYSKHKEVLQAPGILMWLSFKFHKQNKWNVLQTKELKLYMHI